MEINNIIKILKNVSITQEELNSFLSDYIYSTKNKYPTSEELMAINHYIRIGFFDLRYAAIQAGIKLGLYIMNIQDTFGNLLKTHIYNDKEIFN